MEIQHLLQSTQPIGTPIHVVPKKEWEMEISNRHEIFKSTSGSTSFLDGLEAVAKLVECTMRLYAIVKICDRMRSHEATVKSHEVKMRFHEVI